MTDELRDLNKVDMIDDLIPTAVIKANAAMGEPWRGIRAQRWPDEVKDKWNQVYHTEMDRLAKQQGLRR